MKQVAVVCVLITLVGACGGSTTTNESPPSDSSCPLRQLPGAQTVLTESNHDQTIATAVGKQVDVRLTIGGIEGRRWSVCAVDPTIVTMETEAKSCEPPSPPVPDGGGVIYWTFRPTRTGTTELVFRQTCDSDASAPGNREWRATLNIAP